MTSRQTGQKISQIYGHRSVKKNCYQRGGTTAISWKGKRHLAQFLICGTVFVALVAVKLLLPDHIAGISQRVTSLMERNMDVTEVFSAVGHAFSGEEDKAAAWGEVYRSVFHPEEEAVPASAALSGDEQTRQRLSSLMRDGCGWLTGTPIDYTVAQTVQTVDSLADQTAKKENIDAKADQQTASSSEDVSTASLAYILYSDKTVPDNVCMEQEILGFDYCTPVMGTLSSDFGYREHPIEGEEKFHYGVDIAADTGTAIDCFADGTVTAVGESSSYGKYLIVSHENGFSTLYAHCSKIIVSSGAHIKEGQKIAEVGETGMATGPHLHFELHDGNIYLDPIYYVSVA